MKAGTFLNVLNVLVVLFLQKGGAVESKEVSAYQYEQQTSKSAHAHQHATRTAHVFETARSEPVRSADEIDSALQNLMVVSGCQTSDMGNESIAEGKGKKSVRVVESHSEHVSSSGPIVTETTDGLRSTKTTRQFYSYSSSSQQQLRISIFNAIKQHRALLPMQYTAAAAPFEVVNFIDMAP